MDVWAEHLMPLQEVVESVVPGQDTVGVGMGEDIGAGGGASFGSLDCA